MLCPVSAERSGLWHLQHSGRGSFPTLPACTSRDVLDIFPPMHQRASDDVDTDSHEAPRDILDAVREAGVIDGVADRDAGVRTPVRLIRFYDANEHLAGVDRLDGDARAFHVLDELANAETDSVADLGILRLASSAALLALLVPALHEEPGTLEPAVRAGESTTHLREHSVTSDEIVTWINLTDGFVNIDDEDS